jgi:hypothetical protein
MLPSRRSVRTVFICSAVIALVCGIGLYFSWQRDNAILRKQALEITAHLDSDSTRIRAVNDWVYHNKGFDRNDQYFIVPAFGPTPIQVLARGGYCADKSRLVAAMLNSIGIDAGLVMISPCLYCEFIHTVVEAQYEGGRMVVDPTWDVDYPTGDGRFLGVADLAGTNRGQERVTELQRQRPATKIGGMPAADASFENAVAINWDKNLLTRSVAAALQLIGYKPDALSRPRILEDPKLLLIYILLGFAITIALGGFVLNKGRTGNNKERTTLPRVPKAAGS